MPYNRKGTGTQRRNSRIEDERHRHLRLRVDEMKWKKVEESFDAFNIEYKANDYRKRGYDTQIRPERRLGQDGYALYVKRKTSSYPWNGI